MTAAYGLSVITPQVTNAVSAKLDALDKLAYDAFVNGEPCKFKGADANQRLVSANVRRGDQCFVRSFFNALGSTEASPVVDDAMRTNAQTLRAAAIACKKVH